MNKDTILQYLSFYMITYTFANTYVIWNDLIDSF